ncbi:MAG: HlyD family secretion protein [Rhodothalassiaceae bacterium]
MAQGAHIARPRIVSESRLTISTVTRGRFEDFIPVRGRVTPLKTVYLDAVEGGRVEAIHVEDGAHVEAGQLLVTLSNATLQLDVIAREADVTEQLNNLHRPELQLEQNRLAHRRDLVEIDYQITRLGRLVARRKQLVAQGFVSQQDYDAAADELAYWQKRREVTLEAQETDRRLQQAQIKQLRDLSQQLRKNLALARKNLDSLNVRAPVAGLLTAFDLEVGQSLARGDRIVQIDDPERFKLSALIDEFYPPRVDIGQTATVDIAGQTYALAHRQDPSAGARRTVRDRSRLRRRHAARHPPRADAADAAHTR